MVYFDVARCLCVCSCWGLSLSEYDTPYQLAEQTDSALLHVYQWRLFVGQCVGMGERKNRPKKEKVINLVTGRQEVMAVLQPVNSFLDPTDMYLNKYLSPPLAPNTHLHHLKLINLKVNLLLSIIYKRCLLFFPMSSSFFLHTSTSVMFPHPLSTPPSQRRTADSSLGIRASGAQVSPAATLTEPSL